MILKMLKKIDEYGKAISGMSDGGRDLLTALFTIFGLLLFFGTLVIIIIS